MDRTLHRRQNPRLLLGIEAEFICMNGRQPVVLQDISATGAKMEVTQRPPTARGFLRWMDFEVFGDVKWRGGNQCGIIFDRPISNACLVETRRSVPSVLMQQRRDADRHARDFVLGRGAGP